MISTRSFARTCISFAKCPGLHPSAGPAYDTNMPNDRQYSDTEWLDSAQAATLVVVLDEYREYRLYSAQDIG